MEIKVMLYVLFCISLIGVLALFFFSKSFSFLNNIPGGLPMAGVMLLLALAAAALAMKGA